MEKKFQNLKSVKKKEIHRSNYVPGDKVEFFINVKEPIEVIINKIEYVYE